MAPRPSLLAVLVWAALACPARAADFDVAESEKLDAATFLNAISDEPRFNAPWAALRTAWRPRIEADPAAAPAFARWLGRGVQLAYLLSALPEEDLDAVLRRFEDPDALRKDVEAGLDEPAYAPVFRDFRDDLDGVRTVLRFLADHGFREQRREEFGAELARTRARLEAQLAGLDAGKFRDLLGTFVGRPVPAGGLRFRLVVFSRPLCFQLSGFAVAWSGEREDFAWLLAHEFLHKFNPSAATLERLAALAEADPFYRAAAERIHGEFREGREEEPVEAAARWMVERLGPATPTRTRRQLKFLYWSERSGQGGAPLAALLLEALRREPPGEGPFDYDAFVGRQLAGDALRAGSIEAGWRAFLAPVSGMAGMVLAADPAGARVERVMPDRAAARTGLATGDVLEAVDGAELAGKSREDALDLLAGPSGRTLKLRVRGAEGTRTVRLTLE